MPSQTELLYDLGLENRVIGITKFCVHPEHWKHDKAIIGGTKMIKFDVIDGLQPDLIIANKEENLLTDVLRLQERYPVWVSDVSNFDSALEMIGSIGDLTGTSATAKEIIQEIRTEFSSVLSFPLKRALYLIWQKPWMTVGSDTFICDMMKRSGFQNVINDLRYPKLTDNDVLSLSPEVVLLSSEPYPFKSSDGILQSLLPSAKIVPVDGEMFSWYGTRMAMAPTYFKQLRSTLAALE